VNLGLASRGLTGSALHHLAHDHFFHGSRVDACARYGFADDHGPELGRREGGEPSEISADRCPDS